MATELTPGSVAGQYRNLIMSGFDLFKPEHLNKLFMRYGDEFQSFFMLLRSLGFEMPVSQDEYFHHEVGRAHATFHSAAGFTHTPGASQDITLTAADMYDTNYSYPRKKDIVTFPNESQGVISGTDGLAPPTITVIPLLATGDFGTIVADQELIITSGVHAEGSGQPEGAVRRVEKFTNYAQIIKETVAATGSQLARSHWVDVTNTGGPDGPTDIKQYFNLAYQVDLDYRMQLKIDGALLTGTGTDNPLAVEPSNGEPFTTTIGIIPTIRARGNVYPLAPGAFSESDLYDIDKLLTKQGAGNNILVLPGINRHQEIEQALQALFASTNIIYARQVQNDVLFRGNESLAASINFKILTLSERTFNFKRMVNFSNPVTFGADLYPYEDMALFLPLNKRKDPKSNQIIESVGYRYRQWGGINRMFETWLDGAGGLDDVYIGEQDVSKVYQRCHVGNHITMANQMVLMEPV